MLFLLALLLVAFVVEAFLTELEQFGWATITLIATGGATVVASHYWGTPSVLDLVRGHGIYTLAYVGMYVVLGIVWSFFKWFSFLMSFRDAFREQKQAFVKSVNETARSDVFGMEPLDPNAPIPDNKLPAFEDFIIKSGKWNLNWGVHYGNYGKIKYLQRPRAANNKGRITAWASFWPFSFVGTLLNDPIRRLFSFLFNSFKALYQKMSDWVFRKDVDLK